jgi:hypothetical protein
LLPPVVVVVVVVVPPLISLAPLLFEKDSTEEPTVTVATHANEGCEHMHWTRPLKLPWAEEPEYDVKAVFNVTIGTIIIHYYIRCELRQVVMYFNQFLASHLDDVLAARRKRGPCID